MADSTLNRSSPPPERRRAGRPAVVALVLLLVVAVGAVIVWSVGGFTAANGNPEWKTEQPATGGNQAPPTGPGVGTPSNPAQPNTAPLPGASPGNPDGS